MAARITAIRDRGHGRLAALGRKFRIAHWRILADIRLQNPTKGGTSHDGKNARRRRRSRLLALRNTDADAAAHTELFRRRGGTQAAIFCHPLRGVWPRGAVSRGPDCHARSATIRRCLRSLKQRRLLLRNRAATQQLLRIRMPGENGEGAVELFGQHHTGEFVRER